MWPRSGSSNTQQSTSRTSRASAGPSSMPPSYGAYSTSQPAYTATSYPSVTAPSGYYAVAPGSSQASYPVAGTDPRVTALPAQYPSNSIPRFPGAIEQSSTPMPISQEDFDVFMATGFIPNPPFRSPQIFPPSNPPSSRGESSSSAMWAAPGPQTGYSSSSGQSGGRRGSELDELWEEMNQYCRCPDRTQKPLRHWETVCPYNPSKQIWYCDLPRCTNRQGFKTKWSLERHQKNVVH